MLPLALFAAVQVVTFAILEGFRVKAYEKTGEVRKCCCCCALLAGLAVVVLLLLLPLPLPLLLLGRLPRKCTTMSRLWLPPACSTLLAAPMHPDPCCSPPLPVQTGLGPFAPFDPLNMRSDETRLKELKNGEGMLWVEGWLGGSHGSKQKRGFCLRLAVCAQLLPVCMLHRPRCHQPAAERCAPADPPAASPPPPPPPPPQAASPCWRSWASAARRRCRARAPSSACRRTWPTPATTTVSCCCSLHALHPGQVTLTLRISA